MYEFNPSYTLNTGDLTATATGSGVHLNRDVALLFQILDPNGVVVDNDVDLNRNQLISGISFDILSTGGSVVYANYRSGKSVYFSFNEDDNVALFGRYTKDFGIRMKVSNTVNTNVFTSEFYMYGNVPEVNSASVSVIDGTENPYATIPQLFDQIQFNLNYFNDFNYINFDRIDVYASTTPLTGVGLQEDSGINRNLISANPYYVYSKPITSQADANTLIVQPNNLAYDTNYYFALIPYSQLGSGSGYYTPTTYKFAREAPNTGEIIISANQFELIHGDSTMNLDFTTGSIPDSSGYTMDIIEKTAYSTVSYIVEVIDSQNAVASSDLKVVISESSNPTYSGVYLTEYAISSNDLATYLVESDANYVYLKVSGVASTPATFKCYKTSI